MVLVKEGGGAASDLAWSRMGEKASFTGEAVCLASELCLSPIE